MKRTALLPLVALVALGAAPQSSFITATPMPNFKPPPRRAAPTTPPGYTTAPTPNQDSVEPTERASNAASVAPGFFTRRDQYRGEGISASSSAQADQDRRAKPGAGIVLTTPLQ